MHYVLVRGRLRAALASIGANAVELASLTGVELTPPMIAQFMEPIRGPRIDKPDTLRAEAITPITARALDVLRVIAAEHPEALERAITVVNDAAQAEAEAPEAVITDDHGETATPEPIEMQELSA